MTQRIDNRRVRLVGLAVVSLLVSILGLAPAAPARAATTVFADMEHADPFANGWFSFGGSVGGGGIGSNSTDLPPTDGGAFSLQTGWGSGGVPGFFGGFGRSNPVDLTGTDRFNFWINPDAGQDYTLEINLQDDAIGDGTLDDEFQFNCTISAAGPCAVAGGGWQLVSIPLADFFDDNSFLTGGNGVLDARVVNVVIAVISNSGADATFRTDYWVFTDQAPSPPSRLIDDFESGLPLGTDANGNSIGFFTFNDPNSTVAIATGDGPEPVPGAAAGNQVLEVDTDVNGNNGFAGVIHAFENAAVDTWSPQDWSAYEGISFWLYGNNTGSILFLDILDNRAPGTTGDTAERHSIDILDNFSGWKLFEIPFESLRRKEVGNGAPNDGLNLTQVHGWAFGVFDSGVPFQNYLDDVSVYGEADVPELAVGFSANNFDVSEGDTGQITVKLNRSLGDEDPDQVSVDYSVETIIALPDRDFVMPAGGTLTFVKGGASEQTFSIQTIEDSKYEPTERLILRLSNPVDVAAGFIMQASASIVDDDPFDPLLIDDFEGYPYLWDSSADVFLDDPEVTSGGPLAVPGQGAYEHVLEATVPLHVDVAVNGRICKGGSGVIPVVVYSTDDFDATTIDHTTFRLGDAREFHVNRKTGLPTRHVSDVDRDGDLDMVFHFRFSETGLPCDPAVVPINGTTIGGQPLTGGGSTAGFGRDFAVGHDWTDGEALSFWHYGQGTGDEITVELLDNRAPDPGPSGWSLVWADEFSDPAGTPPNSANWGFEIGDGTVNGIPGWGNDELQYYTDDPANAATDGAGHLVITAREAEGEQCYYGLCEVTSARLVTTRKAEFAYGRIESRILVPPGEDGLWPAFWSLGTDITRNPWPAAGEIDFMEFVGRLPNEIFGTIHGPGYSGGGSFGGIYDFGEPVFGSYHTFTVEWEPDLITWYVDGIQYHQATPSDVPGPWVFDKPFFLLLNFAIGGNFGGPVGADFTAPQSMLVDYVRVYQAPDTAERFEASFIDDTEGWTRVSIPVTELVRSAEQPAGAPDDGLTLTEVNGYGFSFPAEVSGTYRIDLVERVPVPPPTELTVTSAADSGEGSLRAAMAAIADGGTITVDPSLAGATVALSQQLTATRSMTIDASAAPGLVLSGSGVDRVLLVEPGASVTVRGLTVTDGAAAPQGGGILNLGNLTLENVVVTGNPVNAAGPPNFAFGGGGIYNGEGATMVLRDSTVSDNTSPNQPGAGVYGFFGSTLTVEGSTISGNVTGDVAGGIRSLGTTTVVNSTISGNTSSAWHGGGIFHTDGSLVVTNSTIVDNIAPAGTASGVVVATFGAPADMTLTNSIMGGRDGALACFAEGGGAAVITSAGGNIDTDGSCFLTATGDQPNTDALLGPLADNGGSTLTHLPSAGSPAIDAALAGACPATDQRGVARPQGAGCDIGAVEAG